MESSSTSPHRGPRPRSPLETRGVTESSVANSVANDELVAAWPTSSRVDVLRAHGATDAELPELLRYTENVFTRGCWVDQGCVPLADEPFVATWERYVAEASRRGG